MSLLEIITLQLDAASSPEVFEMKWFRLLRQQDGGDCHLAVYSRLVTDFIWTGICTIPFVQIIFLGSQLRTRQQCARIQRA